jgi:hypothetical protein
MLYNLLRYFKSPGTRRLLASTYLLTFPLLLAFSLLAGTFMHLFVGVKEYLSDLKTTITHDIPSAFKDLLYVARTGDLI